MSEVEVDAVDSIVQSDDVDADIEASVVLDVVEVDVELELRWRIVLF